MAEPVIEALGRVWEKCCGVYTRTTVHSVCCFILISRVVAWLSAASPHRRALCARTCKHVRTQRLTHHGRSISDPNLHPPQSALQTRLGDF